MATLQEFLKINSGRISMDKLSFIDIPQDSSEVTLNGILVSASEEDYIIFSHIGQRFYITSSDIIDIKESASIPNSPEKEGIAVNITVKANTRFIPYEAITAINLDSGIPFAIARPSQIPNINNSSFTARELAWFSKNGIPINPNTTDPDAFTRCIPIYLNGRKVGDIPG